MSNFTDVQVGDEVLVLKYVHLNGPFSHPSRFYVKVKVERVTSKQFVVEGERYRKKNGCIVKSGEYDRVYKEGGEEMYGCEVVLSDQTSDYEKALERQAVIEALSSVLVSFGKATLENLNSLGPETLADLLQSARSIKKTLNIS